jgi:hypothetical protein
MDELHDPVFHQSSYDRAIHDVLSLIAPLASLQLLSAIENLPTKKRLQISPRHFFETFQGRVTNWIEQCFSRVSLFHMGERRRRFLEEALELVQSCGGNASESHQMVEYVFGRDIGNPPQEVGGVMTTLAGLCTALNIDLVTCSENEYNRILPLIDQIRDKQATKSSLGEIEIEKCSHAGLALQKLKEWEQNTPVYSGSDPRARHYQENRIVIAMATAAIRLAVENGLLKQNIPSTEFSVEQLHLELKTA